VLAQHNGVEGDRFFPREQAEARRKLDLPTGRRIICFVGRLSREKAVDTLIEAMARFQADPEPPLLVIVGNGPAEGALRARAHALGLEPLVRFVGERHHSEVPDWISACDVFCLPSLREGCPNVVLEALASGRPVVASNVGGIPELVSEAEGRLVPPQDPQALAQALRVVLERSWDPQALRASVRFLSWDHYGRTLFETVQEALREWQQPVPSPGLEACLGRSSC
jgi:glycosyltransferase involved in cell wall biosynthesis